MRRIRLGRLRVALREERLHQRHQALDAGLVLNVTAENVIRLLPPLVMSEAEARVVVERLSPLVQRFLEKRVAAA